jgi:hypothetical protein
MSLIPLAIVIGIFFPIVGIVMLFSIPIGMLISCLVCMLWWIYIELED